MVFGPLQEESIMATSKDKDKDMEMASACACMGKEQKIQKKMMKKKDKRGSPRDQRVLSHFLTSFVHVYLSCKLARESPSQLFL